MKRQRLFRPMMYLFFCPALLSSASEPVAAQCQNQIEIDLCQAGCTATSGVCEALCGAAVDVCTGVCVGGCAVTCTIDCCAGFCPDSAACRGCLGNCENDCQAGCQLECDDCIFDCERDCESICRPFRTIGEFCTPIVDRCADGLVCWWLPFPGEARPRCFAEEGDELYPDDVCRAFYSSTLHQGAIDSGLTMSYGTGSSLSAVVSATQELGVVYGPGGEFGCYASQCLGGVSDVEISTYASVGFFLSYDDFPGEDIAIVEGAGEGISFSTSQILSTSGELIGTADALSIGAGLSPIAIGVYDCVTLLDTVGRRNPATGQLDPVRNSPPLALCQDRVVCADPDSCGAQADINNGSIDPDGQPLVLSQAPPGPYGIGDHQVTLTATDPDQESDQCSAVVTVNDCTPPDVQAVTASPAVLWPPNHEMHEVQVDIAASDGCDANLACRIETVMSNEENPAQGPSQSAADYQILDATTVLLRAERKGNGNGRMYTIGVTCEDGSGNRSEKSTRVMVPHDLGDVNSGQKKPGRRHGALR